LGGLHDVGEKSQRETTRKPPKGKKNKEARKNILEKGKWPGKGEETREKGLGSGPPNTERKKKWTGMRLFGGGGG